MATQYIRCGIIFVICRPHEGCRCSGHVIGRGTTWRLLQGIPIGKKRGWLSIEVPRVECYECNAARQTRLGFAEPKVRHTRAFAHSVRWKPEDVKKAVDACNALR